MLQVPALSKLTVEPDTVHTAVVVELKATANPELLTAESVKGAAPTALAATFAKVIA